MLRCTGSGRDFCIIKVVKSTARDKQAILLINKNIFKLFINLNNFSDDCKPIQMSLISSSIIILCLLKSVRDVNVLTWKGVESVVGECAVGVSYRGQDDPTNVYTYVYGQRSLFVTKR